jgi:hypothetical protein
VTDFLGNCKKRNVKVEGTFWICADNSLCFGMFKLPFTYNLWKLNYLKMPPSVSQQESPASNLLAVALLHCVVGVAANRTENTASNNFFIDVCKRRRGHMMSTEPLPINICVYKAGPKHGPSLLATRFLLSTDIWQYILLRRISIFLTCTVQQPVRQRSLYM